MDFVRSHFGKMHLGSLEHILARFVITLRFSSNQNISDDLNSPSNQNIGEGKSNCYDKSGQKVFKWSEVHLSEMTCSKIYTLVSSE